MNDDRLFYAEHAERFNLLIDCLQEWWGGFGMQNGAWMRLEGDHRRHRSGGTRPFDHGFHDELMADVQPIEHAERYDCWPGDVRVIGSVKETHYPGNADVLVRNEREARRFVDLENIARFRRGADGDVRAPSNETTLSLITNHQSVIGPLDILRQQL